MEAWIGPAIVAAFIAALVSVAGWFVAHWSSIGLERRRRSEKVRDYQIALRAEIRSELHDLRNHDQNALFASIEARYAADEKFSVRVPRPARHVVFESLVAELHLLPEGVIDPLVLYNRQRDIIDKLVDDMRASDFKQIAPERQLAMYRDYLTLRDHLHELAGEALDALHASLNSPGAVRWDRRSAEDRKAE